MEIQTQYHGVQVISNEEIIDFPNGLPGFVDETAFVMLPLPENEVFQILQSCQTPSLAFVVTNPFHYFTDYDFALEENTLHSLHIKTEKDVLVYTILTVETPFERTTANLQGPIIVNVRTRKGKQVILSDDKYKTKHALFQEQANVKE
ncbi:flagellar assembly protein FliW [Bacillus spongiae]|uniref:Flagellar assembly factor FliW n=1 Tax=Bacillus spongiae TaxID=2683610 RepID=A0ABU8HEJ6_9BACI